MSSTNTLVTVVATFLSFIFLIESTVIFRDLRSTSLQFLLDNGLNYTHNDTLVRNIINPTLTKNTPSSLTDPWFSSIEHMTNYIPLVANTNMNDNKQTSDGIVHRGPLIGYNRTVQICSPSSLTWSYLPQYTYDISSDWLYITNNIRIPVFDMWSWLKDDLYKEYCWSIRQLPPASYIHEVISNIDDNNPVKTVTNEVQQQIKSVIKEILAEQHISTTEQDYDIHITDRSIVVITKLLSSSASSSASSSLISTCSPYTLRMEFMEWSFPPHNFELIARLALVNDTWLHEGKAYAHSLGIPSALDPVPSSILKPFSSIVPVDLSYREWTRDQIYTKQLHKDNRMYYQDIITFGRDMTNNISIHIDETYLETLQYGDSYFPNGILNLPIHWATRSKWYPPVIPSLESIYTPLSPPNNELMWNLIHWHPSWLVHEYERIQAKDARSPPLSSYVIAPRQFPDNEHIFARYFGETKGIAIYIFICISIVIIVSLGNYIYFYKQV